MSEKCRCGHTVQSHSTTTPGACLVARCGCMRFEALSKPAPMGVKPGWYEHRKGGVYYVVGLAEHTETREVTVLYRDQAGSEYMWSRPVKMFSDGRFTRLPRELQTRYGSG